MTELIDRQVEALQASSSSSRGSSGGGFGVLGGFSGRGGDVLFGGWEGGARLLVTVCIYAALLEAYGGVRASLGAGADGSSGNTSGGDISDSNGPAAAADGEMFDGLEEQQQQQGTATTTSSSSSSQSPLLRLALYQIGEAAEPAPPDSLTPLADSVTRLLGERHPVTKRLRQLAEKNMSLAARQAREMRQQQEQMAAATAVLRVRGGQGRPGVWRYEGVTGVPALGCPWYP